MNRIRRTVAFLTGLALSGLVSLLAVPAVYAATVAPPAGPQAGAATVTASSADLAGWEIATISLAAVLVLVLVAGGVMTLRLRSWARPAIH